MQVKKLLRTLTARLVCRVSLEERPHNTALSQKSITRSLKCLICPWPIILRYYLNLEERYRQITANQIGHDNHKASDWLVRNQLLEENRLSCTERKAAMLFSRENLGAAVLKTDNIVNCWAAFHSRSILLDYGLLNQSIFLILRDFCIPASS